MLEIVFDKISHEPVTPDAAKRTLQEQVIDDDGPGTILRDFDTLLEFVGEEGLRSTGKHFFLPQSELDRLNAMMSRPVVHRLKRPQQRSFPHLHGLYLLLRASGMGIGVGSPPGGRLTLDREIVDAWHGLNPTERYFALLESWLVHGSPEVLGERCGWGSACFQSLIQLAQRFHNRKTVIGVGHRSALYGIMELMTVALMELFGWVQLEYGRPEAGKGVQFEVVERQPLGEAMVAALEANYFANRWPTDRDGETTEPGFFLPLFQHYFPEYQQTLPQKEWSYRNGTYIWRVSLSTAWRQIAAPAETSLDELAMSILDAFEFDADHLYCFMLRQANGRTLRIACPYEEDATAFTDETALGDLKIMEKGTMIMIFDYGDNWQFNIKLEKVTQPDDSLDRVRITAKGGTPPAQYEWYEEEDEWDEEDE